MGGYIRLDKDLVEDPRLLEIADVLANAFEVRLIENNELSGADNEFSQRDARDAWCDALLGAIARLWCYADVHIREDNSLPLSLSAVSQVMRLPPWIIEMMPSEWLEVREDDTIMLPHYIDKNGLIPREKRREQTMLRNRKWRAKKRRQRDANNSASRGASRTRHNSVTAGSHPPGTHVSTKTYSHPIPMGAEEARLPQPPQPPGSLASAIGASLACASKRNGTKTATPPAQHTEEGLEAFALKLHGEGFNVIEVHGCMKQYGTTLEQVERWIGKGGGVTP